MTGPSKSKSIEDLENQLLLKNKDLTEKISRVRDFIGFNKYYQFIR